MKDLICALTSREERRKKFITASSCCLGGRKSSFRCHNCGGEWEGPSPDMDGAICPVCGLLPIFWEEKPKFVFAAEAAETRTGVAVVVARFNSVLRRGSDVVSGELNALTIYNVSPDGITKTVWGERAGFFPEEQLKYNCSGEIRKLLTAKGLKI